MSDICVCGHLLQTHEGPCHSPTCECPEFVSDETLDEPGSVAA